MQMKIQHKVFAILVVAAASPLAHMLFGVPHPNPEMGPPHLWRSTLVFGFLVAVPSFGLSCILRRVFRRKSEHFKLLADIDVFIFAVVISFYIGKGYMLF